jgi:hypothetical protein
VESSCEYGNEPSGSIKCWEAIECFTTGGLSSNVQLHRVSPHYAGGPRGLRSLQSNRNRWFFSRSGIKRPGSEGDNSPPSNAEVKNGGTILPLPHKSPWRSA